MPLARKELQRELNRRVPRGPRGSDQNVFRGVIWFWLQQGRPFDDSMASALEHVRRHAPGFTPRLLPATHD